MQLPKFISDNTTFQLMQDRWAALLNPILAKPFNNGNILEDVPLINGVTVINHLLGRTMQGWSITDANAAASIYRSQPFNNKTLTLTSNAAVTVSILVF